MELLQYWKVIRRRFWVILLLNFVGVLSALWYTSIQPPVFTATGVPLDQRQPEAVPDGQHGPQPAGDLTRSL